MEDKRSLFLEYVSEIRKIQRDNFELTRKIGRNYESIAFYIDKIDDISKSLEADNTPGSDAAKKETKRNHILDDDLFKY